jgi:hypothetical protein
MGSSSRILFWLLICILLCLLFFGCWAAPKSSNKESTGGGALASAKESLVQNLDKLQRKAVGIVAERAVEEKIRGLPQPRELIIAF